MQLGSDIDGDAANDSSGWQVSLNDDGTIVTAVAPSHDNSTGHAKVYKWDGTNWVQLGNDIDGEAVGDSTRSVSTNAYGNTIALGSRYNDGSADDAGHVRVYDWPSTTTYTAGVSQLDFNDLDLVLGDRVIINITGGSRYQYINILYARARSCRPSGRRSGSAKCLFICQSQPGQQRRVARGLGPKESTIGEIV